MKSQNSNDKFYEHEHVYEILFVSNYIQIHYNNMRRQYFTTTSSLILLIVQNSGKYRIHIDTKAADSIFFKIF